MKIKLLLLVFLFTYVVKAQDGTLDTDFGNNGVIGHSIFNEFVDMKVDYYNKVVALGKNANGIPILVRFNSDGSLDTTFDSDGIKEIDFGGTNETPASFCIFDNGGSSLYGYLVASSQSGKIARVLNDGTFAPNFGTNGIYTYSTGISPISFVNYDWANYKIIVFQSNGNFSNSTGGKIYRLNTNGTPDTTYNNGNPINFNFNSSVIIPTSIQSDDSGSVYISGYYAFNNANYVAKFSTTGARVWSYEPTASSETIPGYLFDASDNTSYAYGSSWSGSVNQMTVRKHNSAGNGFETSFGTNGSAYITIPNAYYANIKSILMHQYGISSKIILAGRSREASSSVMANITVARLNSDGSLDTGFGTSGITSVPTNLPSYTLHVASAVDYETGKLYIMGTTGVTAAGRSALNTTPTSLTRLNLGSILSTLEVTRPKITVYPNPTQSILNFSTNLKDVKIYDIIGRLIQSNIESDKKINISGLSNGNYILKGETELGIMIVEKFVKN